MARKIKLYDTGEIVEKSPDLYYAPNRKWFSSYDAYLAYDLENSVRSKCIDKMYEILGLNSNQKICTVFFKRLNEWHEGYNYSTILKAMGLCEESIRYSLRVKDFDNEYSQMSYIMAIIQNNLNDALKMIKFEHKVKQNETIDSSVAEGIEYANALNGCIKGTNVSDLVGDV